MNTVPRPSGRTSSLPSTPDSNGIHEGSAILKLAESVERTVGSGALEGYARGLEFEREPFGPPGKILAEFWLKNGATAATVAHTLEGLLDRDEVDALALNLELPVPPPGTRTERVAALVRSFGLRDTPDFSDAPGVLLRACFERAWDVLAAGDRSSRQELESAVREVGSMFESALRPTIAMLACALPWYAERVRKKLNGDPAVPLVELVDHAALKALIGCLAALNKDCKGDPEKSREVETLVGARVDLDHVFRAVPGLPKPRLELLVDGRNLAAHARRLVDPADRVRMLRGALQALVDLDKPSFWRIVPKTYVLVERRESAAGQHLEVVDESGRRTSLFLAATSAGWFEKLYCLSNSNPCPVAPFIRTVAELL